MRSCDLIGGLVPLSLWESSSHLGCWKGGVMAKGDEQVMVWIQDEMTMRRSGNIISSGLTKRCCCCTGLKSCTNEGLVNRKTLHDQGPNPSSSWLDTPHWGVIDAVEMKCAGAGGPGAGKRLDASRRLVYGWSFCWERFFGTARGPIFLRGSGAPCYCDAGEDLHAVRQNKWVSDHQNVTVMLLLRSIFSSHHRIAKTVVPVCIAIPRCCYVTVVGASPIGKGVRGVVMPTLGLKGSFFTIPRTQRMSLARWDVFLLHMVDCSLNPVHRQAKAGST